MSPQFKVGLGKYFKFTFSPIYLDKSDLMATPTKSEASEGKRPKVLVNKLRQKF